MPEVKATNYRVGFLIPGEPGHSFNAMVFATKEEAVSHAKELMSRWFIPEGFDIMETIQPVNGRKSA